MHILTELHRAPAIRSSQWLNTDQPLSLLELRGQVVLIDFWDYACVNCLHTFPYLKAWHERYAAWGLHILGIHTPEFDFAKEAERVAIAVQRFELPYPIAIDSDSETWNAYGNRYWPAKYLIDTEGRVRAFHFGEGAYPEMEREIQKLLSGLHPEQLWPDPVPFLAPLDDPLAFCQRPTPERYFGTDRGVFDASKPDPIALTGQWQHHRQCSEHTDDQPASLSVAYSAASVNLVLQPGENQTAQFSVLLDNQPLSPDYWGDNITADASGHACVVVSEARMYNLIRTEQFESHQLTMTTRDPGVKAYAFTFGSCVSPDTALA